MGTTNSALMRPLSSGDGMGGDKGISSFIASFISEIEAVEIFSWSIKPKAPSKYLERKKCYNQPGQYLFFPSPHTLIWQLFLLNEWLALSMSSPKMKTVKQELRKQGVIYESMGIISKME